uniref:Lymphocyte antigen 6 complex, locus E n=1 Tax=Gallus gallus TaxID=9031 RepID=A0A8V0Y3K6_CHICK
MKAFLLAVLAAVLCVERAHTLICFSCSDASSNWACLTPVKCAENEEHCVTTYVGVGIGEIARNLQSPSPSTGFSQKGTGTRKNLKDLSGEQAALAGLLVALQSPHSTLGCLTFLQPLLLACRREDSFTPKFCSP